MQKDLYFVAVKVFLRKGGKLLILKDSFGHWDIPGGRLLPTEFNVPLEKVIARKMREELGAVRYALGKPVVFMRHERKEKTPLGNKARIFAIGYEAKFAGGIVKLSVRHPEMKWVSIDSVKPQEYFNGGWLRGVQEYLNLQRARKLSILSS